MKEQKDYVRHLNQVEAINDCAMRNPQHLIDLSEKSFHQELSNIASDLLKRKAKVVLLAGPSSSGKTTTAHMLGQCLTELGNDAQVISLDDFYKMPQEAPKNADGTPDFESIYALRIDEIQRSLRELMEHSACDKPQFDFHHHCPFKEMQHIELKPGGIAIVEGIHALNPIFSGNIPKEGLIKIYISIKQGIEYKNEQLLGPNEVRMIRRIVRDYAFRSTNPAQTIAMWPSVMNGEYRYIKPFRSQADYTINSLHAYEPCVFRTRAMRLLRDVEESEGKEYEIAQQLFFVLKLFRSISPELVPKNSLLREFLGGGFYD